MPGRSNPISRSPWRSAYARASTGIWRRAPGVPCIHTIAGPRRDPYSAKLNRRSPRTATVPSSAGRLTWVMAAVWHAATASPGADHERAVHHVEHDTGDVVPAARLEGRLGQDGGGGVRVLQAEHLRDAALVDQVGEPVAAQQQPVPFPNMELDEVEVVGIRVGVA